MVYPELGRLPFLPDGFSPECGQQEERPAAYWHGRPVVVDHQFFPRKSVVAFRSAGRELSRAVENQFPRGNHHLANRTRERVKVN